MNDTPKLAFIANSIGVFNALGKETAEKQLKTIFDKYKNTGQIHPDSIFYTKRIAAPHEARQALDTFLSKNIDGLVVLNSAFPNGNAFLTFAADARLWRIPLIITAPPEIDLGTCEWTTNAYCGLIMNNYAAKRLGRHVFILAGWPEDNSWQQNFEKLIRVMYTIKCLRNEIVGKIGDAPGGFHCAAGDPLAYAKVFGIRIETVDLLQVVKAYQSGAIEGVERTASFSDSDVETIYTRMLSGKTLSTDSEVVKRAARLYCALKTIVNANGFTSISLRCWPEIMQTLNVSACFVLGQLLSDGIVTAAACEGDWPTAVSQAIATYLTGQPAACLDFVNQIGASNIIQAGHCGVGIPRLMESAQINDISPDRQANTKIGPTCIGQFKYGPKTGLALMKTETGQFKMLAFTGTNSKQTQKGMLYAAADIEVKNATRLNDLILEHGFPHHLAVAFGDIRDELKMLCDFAGTEFITVKD
jgi:L-fucose isomerase-like protein